MSSLSLVALVEFIGRALVASLFLISGTRKAFNPARTKEQITEAGIPLPAVVYPITLMIDFVGGLSLLFGYRVSEAAVVLALFTLLIAVTMHRNWADRAIQNQFLMDITITGGLLVICANGAGPISVASWMG